MMLELKNRDERLWAAEMAHKLGYPSVFALRTRFTDEEWAELMTYAKTLGLEPPQSHASAKLSDALRDLALRVHEDVSRTEHTVTEDKLTGEVVETLTIRWKREGAA